jgi:hypothetical protein
MEDKSKEIIKEEQILLRGNIYKQTIYADTHVELLRFNEKYKMWIKQTFKPEGMENKDAIKNLIEVAKRVL